MKVSDERPIKRVAAQDLVENVIKTTLSKAGLDTDYYKVFAIGFYKTGTTSIYKLFAGFGLSAMDGPHWRKNEQWSIHYQFQAFSDGPPEDFRHLDATFPRSKFILNVRDLDEWLDSRVEHVRFRRKDPKYKSKMSQGKEPDVDMLVSWIQRRQKYHLDVLSYFHDRPSDLMVVNYISNEKGAELIAGFLGFDTDGIAKPYERSTPKTRTQGRLRNSSLIEEAFNRLDIMSDDHRSDVLCRSLMDRADALKYQCDTREQGCG